MKEYVCLLVGVAFLAVACHKKETTVTNPEETKTEENTTIVDEAANAPVTNLPTDKKTETKTTVNQSPTPTPLSETTLPMESSTPIANESPDASSDTGTNLPAENTTGGNAAVFGGSSSSSNTASPEFTVNPARDALRKQIQSGGRMPSPTP
jgi:hypothetical protein